MYIRTRAMRLAFHPRPRDSGPFLGVQDTRHRAGHHGCRCGLQIKPLVDLPADPIPHVTGPSGIGCSSEKAAKEVRETPRRKAPAPRSEDHPAWI